jgi:hypothetical protein
MTDMKLSAIHRVFSQCFHDAGIFKRDNNQNEFFEITNIKKDKKQWLVIAAGISPRDASSFFTGNKTRKEKATSPITIIRSCKLSILFVVRPAANHNSHHSPSLMTLPFSKRNSIPEIEVREAYIRINDLPDNDKNISNIRWEYEIRKSREEPMEDWLREWKKDFGYNPAHPPSHLHLNSDQTNQDESSHIRKGDLVDNLRLAIGEPNPLAFILSLASWIRTIH